MKHSLQSFGSLCVAFICIISLALSGCENPGSVGSDLTDSGGDVETDTLIINGVQSVSANSYSGALPYFSMGQFDDPLFGNTLASGFIKPGLPADSAQNMDENATMLMRLLLDNMQAYGDSTADQQFSIYEVDEAWRGRALKVNDDLAIDQSNKLGEFTIGFTDSIDVDLSAMAPDWVDRYRQFTDTTNADSLYKYDMFGLALVPENSNKIVPIDVSTSRFVIQNPDSDTVSVGSNQWGYTVQRGSNTSFPEGTVPLHSTYENVLNFSDLGLSELDLSVTGISRAEMIIKQNNTVMEQTLQSASANAHRPEERSVFLHLADPNNIPDNIDPGAPVDNFLKVQGVYSPSDGTYRFDVTNLIGRVVQQGLPDGNEFFITFPNDGIIKPALIYTDSDQVSFENKPKIVITSLKNSSS